MPALLEPRQGYYCYDNFGNVIDCNNNWYSWGRWVALAAVIVGFILIFFIFSCITARRRRRRGMQPYYGTGWVGRTPFGHGAAQYNPQYGHQQQWQPQQEQNYVAPQGQAGGYYNYGQHTSPPAYDPANRGFYGQSTGTTQSTGVYEMQPPDRTQGAPQASGAKPKY